MKLISIITRQYNRIGKNFIDEPKGQFVTIDDKSTCSYEIIWKKIIQFI